MIAPSSGTGYFHDWRYLTKLEPRLRTLAAEADHVREWADYEYLKARASRLVGWRAPANAPSVLRTERAYDSVMIYLLRRAKV